MFYKKKLTDCENNVKKTWDKIREVIGKSKLIDNGLPKMMVIDQNLINIDQHLLLINI